MSRFFRIYGILEVPDETRGIHSSYHAKVGDRTYPVWMDPERFLVEECNAEGVSLNLGVIEGEKSIPVMPGFSK